MLLRSKLALLCCAALAALLPTASAEAAPAPPATTDVEVHSGQTVLGATVVHAPGPGRHPGVVLVSGSGAHRRNDYRLEAEAFARAGVTTLIYDKRSDGYAASGLGQRSYSTLADDALAAVHTLRQESTVDPQAVGLWGHSEGGWVVPLAASRSPEVAFVVTVGASGVVPPQQTAWALQNRFAVAGVTGSVVAATTTTMFRLLAGIGLFDQADYQAAPVLERLHQPVLAIWGDRDRTVPPAESARITQAALDKGGNRHYAIRFVAGGDHAAHNTSDGFLRENSLPTGYPELVTGWIRAVADGRAPAPGVTPLPQQLTESKPFFPITWYESAWVQLGALAVFLLAFAGYPVTALVRRLRGSSVRPPRGVRAAARSLAGAASAAVLGLFGYFGYLELGSFRNAHPVLAGRTLGWLTVQALAVLAVVALVWLAVSWRRADSPIARSERYRLGLLTVAGALFVPWAVSWGLLLP